MTTALLWKQTQRWVPVSTLGNGSENDTGPPQTQSYDKDGRKTKKWARRGKGKKKNKTKNKKYTSKTFNMKAADGGGAFTREN